MKRQRLTFGWLTDAQQDQVLAAYGPDNPDAYCYDVEADQILSRQKLPTLEEATAILAELDPDRRAALLLLIYDITQLIGGIWQKPPA